MAGMSTNPGGQLAPDEIVGRDELIDYMWRVLQGQCIYMNDLRRIGKTQIMVKMHANPPQGWVCAKRDLGGCHTADEFARQAYDDSAAMLTGGKKAMRRMSDLLGKAAGTEIAGVIKLSDGSTAPWKEVLERTFSDLNENAKQHDIRVLYLWDEFPFLIDNIAKRESTAKAMEVLDVVRALTQNYDYVRVLLTGSIGLHHVLQSLKQDGYSGSPLNRMELVRPGPLLPEDAKELARALLQGESIQVDDVDQCAATISNCCGNVPFYIHKLISRLNRATEHSPTSINAALELQLADLNNDWDLDHYRSRLRDYYGEDVPTALAVLDAVAIHHTAMMDDIRSAVAASMEIDSEQLRGIVKLLCQDHYLTHSADGEYSFYLQVVARWWRISRDLKPQS